MRNDTDGSAKTSEMNERHREKVAWMSGGLAAAGFACSLAVINGQACNLLELLPQPGQIE